MIALNIIPTQLMEQYRRLVDAHLSERFNALKDAEISTSSFNFYTSVSAIASSRIEGEQLEVDSYIKHKMLGTQYQPDLLQKPNDLYRAYLFAQENALDAASFQKAHAIITNHLLPANRQGALRTGNILVMEHNTGRIQFEAVAAGDVENLMNAIWQDIEALKAAELSAEEVFYFASFIHLVFVCVHPFDDGNGRAGRLLEKWFIAERLGPKAWFLQSELYYYNNVGSYYKNLNRLGVFFDQLDYAKALPFLLMLPEALMPKGSSSA